MSRYDCNLIDSDRLRVAKMTAKPNVPIVNYAVSAIMEPTTLIGAIFGVMMNHIFPNWLILALLITLLSFITYKTYLKGTEVRVCDNAVFSAFAAWRQLGP